MKIVNRTILDDDVELFDSDKDQGTIIVKMSDDFELWVEPGLLHGNPVISLQLQARVGAGRLVIYPQITNAIHIGKARL